MRKEQRYISALFAGFRSATNKSLRSIILFLLVLHASKVFPQNDIDSLQKLLKNATLSEKLDLTLSLSKAYWSVAPATGLDLANKAFRIAEQADNQSKKAKALLYGGVNYWAMGEYDNAIHYYDKCLRIAENIGDQKLAAFALNNIGMIYHEEGDYTKAMSYFNQALSIMKKLNDNIEYAKIINSKGKLNADLHKYAEALKNYQLVVYLIRSTNERKLLLWVLNDIGEVYERMNQTAQALSYFKQALQIANNLSDQIGKSMVYNNIGRVYLLQRDFITSEDNFHRAASFARSAKANDRLMTVMQNLSELYSQKGDYKQSLKYFRLYKNMSDSIYSEKKIKNIINLQTRYETEAKEKKIELLRKDSELNHLRISQQDSFRNLLLALLLVIMILTVIIYNRLQLKKKANKLLAAKNAMIEKQKTELAEVMLHLQQTNAKLEEQKREIQEQVEVTREAINTKDRFFSIIAHDLRSPFNSILGFGSLLIEHIQDRNYEEIEEYAIHMQRSSQRAFDLLKNLLEWSRSQTGRMEFKPELLDIKSIINEVVELINDSAQQKSITILCDLQHTTILFADRAMLSTILRNLISNAIKFTRQGGKIDISSEFKQNQLMLSISDDGVGINEDVIEKLFRIEESFSTLGTLNEKGTGLGLILCKEFVEKHGGEIWVESQVGKGSKFHFTLPMK